MRILYRKTKPQDKRAARGPERRWKDNNEIYLKNIGCEGMGSTQSVGHPVYTRKEFF
jgi:hypothetical protein